MGMKKSNALAIMSLLYVATASDMVDEFNHETMKRPLNKKPVKKIIPKGLTEFFYGENSVWALNKKNADRKARNKGYL